MLMSGCAARAPPPFMSNAWLIPVDLSVVGDDVWAWLSITKRTWTRVVVDERTGNEKTVGSSAIQPATATRLAKDTPGTSSKAQAQRWLDEVSSLRCPRRLR